MTTRQIQPGRIIIPGNKVYDIKIAITFNSVTKQTELFVEKGSLNQYGIMTLCLQHAAMTNSQINIVTAPQSETQSPATAPEDGGTNGAA